jgi:hypothetical protein
MQRQSGLALFADEVALEEAATRDESVLRDASEQCDAPLDGDQTGVLAAGKDLGGQVDQFCVFAPRADGDGDVPARPEVAGQSGEDAGEPGEQPVVADVGEVPAVEGVAVEDLWIPVVWDTDTCPWVDGPYGGDVTTSAACPTYSGGSRLASWRASPWNTRPSWATPASRASSRFARATPTQCGSYSIPTARRPAWTASTSVVPIPHIGSSTRSPGLV